MWPCLAWRDICSCGVRNYQEPLDFLPTLSLESVIFVLKSNLIFLIYKIFLSEIQGFLVPFFSMAYLLLCA